MSNLRAMLLAVESCIISLSLAPTKNIFRADIANV